MKKPFQNSFIMESSFKSNSPSFSLPKLIEGSFNIPCEYSGKLCLVEFKGKVYRGFDLGKNIELYNGQNTIMSLEKGLDLVKYYKDDFSIREISREDLKNA